MAVKKKRAYFLLDFTWPHPCIFPLESSFTPLPTPHTIVKNVHTSHQPKTQAKRCPSHFPAFSPLLAPPLLFHPPHCFVSVQPSVSIPICCCCRCHIRWRDTRTPFELHLWYLLHINNCDSFPALKTVFTLCWLWKNVVPDYHEGYQWRHSFGLSKIKPKPASAVWYLYRYEYIFIDICISIYILTFLWSH